jgi:hypothetical protein
MLGLKEFLMANAFIRLAQDILKTSYSKFIDEFTLKIGHLPLKDIKLFYNTNIWKVECHFDLRTVNLHCQIIFIDRVENALTYLLSRLNGGLFILLLSNKSERSHNLLMILKVDARDVFCQSI